MSLALNKPKLDNSTSACDGLPIAALQSKEE